MEDIEKTIAGYSATKVLINGIDDGINEAKKDKNSIYNMLKEDMAEDPELAAYVAGKMSKSLTLEEANLIGDAALVVYQFMLCKVKNKIKNKDK